MRQSGNTKRLLRLAIKSTDLQGLFISRQVKMRHHISPSSKLNTGMIAMFVRRHCAITGNNTKI